MDCQQVQYYQCNGPPTYMSFDWSLKSLNCLKNHKSWGDDEWSHQNEQDPMIKIPKGFGIIEWLY